MERDKMERIFNGIYGIVLTPFKENGDVDYRTLEKHVEKSMKSEGLAGLVVCGSTGEFTRLDFEENIRLMQTVKDVMGGRKQFVCGITAGESYTAIKYLDRVSEMGVDGALLAPPYYFKLTEDEIFGYYNDVIRSNSAKVPIVGYNIPQCTNPVSVANFEKLLQFDSFKGFKNSWNDMQEITTEIALRNEKRPDVSMLTGLDACLYGTFALGGDGIFSAISYLMPDIMYFIQSNFGKNDRAFKCQCELIKLINIVNRFTFPYGYRVLSDAVGNNLGEGREAVPLSIKNAAYSAKKEMRNIYDKLIFEYTK